MAIETEVVARLKTEVGVAALVGGRVFPVVLPTDVAPAITYRRLSGVPEINLDGSIAMTSVQLELSAWGSSYEQARTLADAIFSALDGWQNGDGVIVSHASFGPDLYEPEVPDSVRFRCLVEVEVLER
jgi:hypothetical protein